MQDDAGGALEHGDKCSRRVNRRGDFKVDGQGGAYRQLSISEGDFHRSRKLQLSEGEVRDLKYQFSEPTLNATNVEMQMECAPGA
jgi:hypothetical protein